MPRAWTAGIKGRGRIKTPCVPQFLTAFTLQYCIRLDLKVQSGRGKS